MTALHIFVDESGTMPSLDTAPPFVVAAVSVQRDLPATDLDPTDISAVVRQYRDAEASVAAALVVPFDGFVDQLAARTKRVNELGRRRLRIDGANAPYFSKQGMNPRNVVWMKAVLGAVGHRIGLSVSTAEPPLVNVYVDRKTLQGTDAALVKRTVERIPRTLGRLAQEAAQAGFVRQAKELASAVRTTAVNFHWSNERASHGAKRGLRLADALAYQIREHALAGQLGDLANALGFSGPNAFVGDMTRTLVDSVIPAPTLDHEDAT